MPASLERATTAGGPAVVYCGHCKRRLVRTGRRHLRHGGDAPADLPLVHTRTLVGGVFLPSCSEECAGLLRGRN